MAARFRLGDGPHDVPTATKFALRSVARRYEALSEEIIELDAHLDRLVAQAAPELVSLPGIGTDNAATLLIVALKTTPREVEERGLLRQSVRSLAHRGFLRQGRAASSQPRVGNRDANRALYMICLARMRRDRRTQEYVARRTAGEAWQEQARDHPLPQALRRQGGLPRADLLRRPFLADMTIRGGPHRLRKQRRLTIGASLW